MQVIDIVFIALIVLMTIHGLLKGFVGELFSWAALVLSIWVAVLLFPAGGAFIRTRAMEDVRIVPELLAFAAIFLIIMISVKLLERILRNIIEGARLGSVNKFLGAVFGLVEGLALVALIVFVLRVQPLFNAAQMLGESVFAQFLEPFLRILPGGGNDISNTALLIMQSWKYTGV